MQPLLPLCLLHCDQSGDLCTVRLAVACMPCCGDDTAVCSREAVIGFTANSFVCTCVCLETGTAAVRQQRALCITQWAATFGLILYELFCDGSELFCDGCTEMCAVHACYVV